MEELRKSTRAWLISSVQASRNERVSPSQSQENSKEKTTQGTNGRPRGIPLASFNLNTSSWRMSQACFLTNTSGKSLGTLPKWGTIVDGELYPQQTPAHLISGKGGGVWPSPRANIAMSTTITDKTASANFPNLETVVARQQWPSPTKQDTHNNGGPSQYDRNSLPLNAKAGGQLNPAWVCWLMGWPINWESLEPLTELTWLDWSVDPADLTEGQEWPTPKAGVCGMTAVCSDRPKDKSTHLSMQVHLRGRQGTGPIPRIATGIPSRVNRLKALGNGIVPQCMELAWRILSNEN